MFYIVQRIYEVSMRLGLSKFNFKFTRLFIAGLKIVSLRFRNFLLHCWYMGGILTVVRACTETQNILTIFDNATFAVKLMW